MNNSAPGTVYDVIVAGGGNAGFSAAHAAREAGAGVLLLERGAEAESGGNSFYTAGAIRVAHGGQDALAPFVDEESCAKIPVTEIAPYTTGEFEADMERVTGGRGDPQMAALVAAQSQDMVEWLAGKGVHCRLMYERQSYLSDGKYIFFGNLAVGVVGGGKGLVEQHTASAIESGIELRYGAELIRVLQEGDKVSGVVVRNLDGSEEELACRALVLAAGGFEANPEWRAKYLGKGWERAHVRGTPLNDGEVLQLALDLGAARHGDWATCHSTAWDIASPPLGGDRRMTNQHTRQSYPIGIVVNLEGERFLDEGFDFRNYTYAKYGGAVLAQTDGRAFQVFDGKTRPMLRAEEYDTETTTELVADTVEELGRKMGVDVDAFVRTVTEFNASIDQQPFNPTVKDGRRADVVPPKSNWALEIDTAPFYAYPITCGITFTFGGIRVDEGARVLRESGTAIPGLFAAGEIVGGLFSGNYPGGSGLTAGTVYGRLAGRGAARLAQECAEAVVGRR